MSMSATYPGRRLQRHVWIDGEPVAVCPLCGRRVTKSPYRDKGTVFHTGCFLHDRDS